MNYATIKNCDIANGPGVRVSLFVSGCTHRCPGCFNEVAWDFGYGQPFTQDTIDTILNMLDEKFRTIRNGKGIAFAVPLSSVIGVNIYRFLSNNQM